MRASVVISALVAVVVGFGGSLAIVLAAAQALGASEAQTWSWVTGLCLGIMGVTAILSVRHRVPIVAAGSTPGAALITGSSGVSLEAAVGAFFLAAVLVLLTAVFRPALALVERIPVAIASAMLAGIIFGFVMALFDHLQGVPALVFPLLVAFVAIRLFSPSWAVLTVLVLGVVLANLLGLTEPLGSLQISSFTWITPTFDAATLIGLGLPLYLVTMASQNLPGFAVLRAADYPVPARSILTVTGLASLLTAGVGAHATNLAAITAAICTGPEAHPDKDKRWLCGPIYAASYALLALFGASFVTLFASFPAALVATVAAIALFGPFLAALAASLAESKQRFAAAVTFVVTASGISAFDVGSAFWGLTAGLVVLGLEATVRDRKP